MMMVTIMVMVMKMMTMNTKMIILMTRVDWVGCCLQVAQDHDDDHHLPHQHQDDDNEHQDHHIDDKG